ncbi:MAG: chain-length determining protein [Bacteroidales bacterium]|nr:chain-length determining protein [Bacteroidales bacterium]
MENEEIDIMELVRKVLKEWKFIAFWCFVAAVIGVVVVLSTPRKYAVNMILAPEIAKKGVSGNLSALAGMAGINLGGLNSSSEAIYADLYPDIVSSTPFIVEMFSTPVAFNKKKEVVETDVYDYLKNYTKIPWWSAVINLPFKALGAFISLFREKEEEVEGYSNLNPAALTREQAEIAAGLRKSIGLNVDKKTSVINATVVAQNPQVAYQIAEATIEKLQKYVSNYRTEKARIDLEYYQQLYDEAKEDYYASQEAYASYVDAHQGIVHERVRAQLSRLNNEMNLKYTLYNSCAQQLQVAKANVQRETPVWAVINPPTIPIRAATSRLKTLMVFVFLGACCAVGWVLLGRDALSKFRNGGEKA